MANDKRLLHCQTIVQWQINEIQNDKQQILNVKKNGKFAQHTLECVVAPDMEMEINNLI